LVVAAGTLSVSMAGLNGGTIAALLDDAETLASIAQAVATTAAFVVGGLWAYYRFFKERTYRVHVHLSVDAEWIVVHGKQLLLCTTVVRNAGATHLPITQQGSGLIVASAGTTGTPPAATD
jgi:hypothetical protein